MYTVHLASGPRIGMAYYAEHNGGEMQFDVTNGDRFVCANVTPREARQIVARLNRFLADVKRRKAKRKGVRTPRRLPNNSNQERK